MGVKRYTFLLGKYVAKTGPPQDMATGAPALCPREQRGGHLGPKSAILCFVFPSNSAAIFNKGRPLFQVNKDITDFKQKPNRIKPNSGQARR